MLLPLLGPIWRQLIAMDVAQRFLFFIPVILRTSGKVSPAQRVRAYIVCVAWFLALWSLVMRVLARIAAWVFLVMMQLLLLLFSTMTLFSLQGAQESLTPTEVERLSNPTLESAAGLRIVQFLQLFTLDAYMSAFIVLLPSLAHDAYRWHRGEFYIDETTIWRDRKRLEWASLIRFALDSTAFVWLLTVLVVSALSDDI